MAPASTAGSTGETIREPVGKEKGYWAGAPGAFYATDEGAWYVTYRIRRPRGIAPDRGGEARIMRSTDLQNFTDVWSVIKDRYDTASIERSAIRKGADGRVYLREVAVKSDFGLGSSQLQHHPRQFAILDEQIGTAAQEFVGNLVVVEQPQQVWDGIVALDPEQVRGAANAQIGFRGH